MGRRDKTSSVIIRMQDTSQKAETAIQEARRQLNRVELLLAQLATEETRAPAAGKNRRSRRKPRA